MSRSQQQCEQYKKNFGTRTSVFAQHISAKVISDQFFETFNRYKAFVCFNGSSLVQFELNHCQVFVWREAEDEAKSNECLKQIDIIAIDDYNEVDAFLGDVVFRQTCL